MIATLIKTFLAPYETYLWAGLAVVLTFGGLYFVHHERAIGEQKVIAADARAAAALKAEVKKQTQELQDKADAAEKERVTTQQNFDAYMSAHPVGALIVCGNPRSGGQGVPAAPAQSGISASAGPGPAMVPGVPAGSPGVNIGPAINTILRASGAMAGLYREAQEDYVNAQRQR